MVSLAEARRIIGAVFCPTCGVDTLPIPPGICGFCDTQIVERKPRRKSQRERDAENGRFVPGPLPVPPVVEKGCCIYCGGPIQGDARYKKLYCSDKHRHAYWTTYTEKGRASRQRYWLKRTKQVAA